jgi:hypothetical protein
MQMDRRSGMLMANYIDWMGLLRYMQMDRKDGMLMANYIDWMGLL